MKTLAVKQLLKKHVLGYFCLLLGFSFTFFSSGAYVFALSDAQRQVFELGINAFDVDDECAPDNTATQPDPAGQAMGNVPAGGMWVSASNFGGKSSGGKMVANWADNGGNDMGNHSNHLTYGQVDPDTKKPAGPSFAELGGNKALGGLPNHTKLKITYKDKSVVALKEDSGGHTGSDTFDAASYEGFSITSPKPPVGQPIVRAVDLWWQTANDLGVTETVPVFIQVVTDAGANVVSGTDSGPVTKNLPPQTIKALESFGIDDKVAKMKSRYDYASKQTGVPWQIIATLHYREASMDPNKSIQNGEPRRSSEFKNIDGITVYPDAAKDDVQSVEHFIDNAKHMYQIDVKKSNLSEKEIGEAFLAYNRGVLYKRAGLDYTKSGYVMQGIDADHIGGDWVYLDPFGGHPQARKLNNSNPGALAVFYYLGGKFSGQSGGFDKCSNPSGAIRSASCDVTKPIYGSEQSGGNGRQLKKADLIKLYGQPNDKSSQTEVDFLGKKLTVHKKVAGCLEAVANELKQKNVNYKIKEIGAFRTTPGAGQVKDGESYHQYGVALDINWSTNPYTSGASAPYDIPKEYIEAFQNHGWSWGGYWTSIKDYMHFEFNGFPVDGKE